jgi:hypothetical protein
MVSVGKYGHKIMAISGSKNLEVGGEAGKE